MSLRNRRGRPQHGQGLRAGRSAAGLGRPSLVEAPPDWISVRCEDCGDVEAVAWAELDARMADPTYRMPCCGAGE